MSALCDCSVSTVSWDEDDDIMNSCGTNFVLFHPLTSFEVKTRTIFEIFWNQKIITRNYHMSPKKRPDRYRKISNPPQQPGQSYFVLNSFLLPIFGFAFAFTMLGCLWHGIAGVISLSNFLLGILRLSEYFLSSGSIKLNSSQSSSVVELWSLSCPLLSFSTLSGFTNFGRYFCPYTIWFGCRLNFLWISPDHICPLGGFSSNRVRIDIPIVIDTLLLHDVQIIMSYIMVSMYFTGGNVSSLGTFEHYRALVSRLPILAFLSSERLLPFWTRLQATNSQVWQLLEFL